MASRAAKVQCPYWKVEDAAARAGVIDIPGVRVWQETSVAVGARVRVVTRLQRDEQLTVFGLSVLAIALVIWLCLVGF